VEATRTGRRPEADATFSPDLASHVEFGPVRDVEDEELSRLSPEASRTGSAVGM